MVIYCILVSWKDFGIKLENFGTTSDYFGNALEKSWEICSQ